MNERIKELAEQAELLHKQIGPALETRHMKKKEKDLEKFAELIVKECCAQIENERPIFIPTEWDQGSSWGHKNSIDVIKQHFGV